jgi:hypothetical protein
VVNGEHVSLNRCPRANFLRGNEAVKHTRS